MPKSKSQMNYALCIWKKVKYKFAKRVMWLKLDMEEINGLELSYIITECLMMEEKKGEPNKM